MGLTTGLACLCACLSGVWVCGYSAEGRVFPRIKRIREVSVKVVSSSSNEGGCWLCGNE